MNNRDRILVICNRHNLIPQATVELAEEIIAIIKEDGGRPNLRPFQQKEVDDLMESFKEPQLIQGYTAAQWQEIIDGGYLCEFSFSTDFDRVYSSLLSDHGHDEHEGTHYFHPVNDKTNDFLCCRPAQIKGVMRPIFVEPVDDKMWVALFCGVEYLAMCRWQGFKNSSIYSSATKYIEL